MAARKQKRAKGRTSRGTPRKRMKPKTRQRIKQLRDQGFTILADEIEEKSLDS